MAGASMESNRFRAFCGMISYLEIATLILEEGQEMAVLRLILQARKQIESLGYSKEVSKAQVNQGVALAAGQLQCELGNMVLEKMSLIHPHFGEKIPKIPREEYRKGYGYGASQDATWVP